MQSYQQLDQMESMCGLVAFCEREETGEILAAFEYNDFSLSEGLAVKMHRFRLELSHKRGTLFIISC